MHKWQERKGQDVIIVFLNEMIDGRIIWDDSNSLFIFISNMTITKEKKIFSSNLFVWVFFLYSLLLSSGKIEKKKIQN